MVLDAVYAGGALNLIGLGWLGSYLVLSGSPVAASAMTLLDAGVITPMEAFGQVVGSRMGASFVVLGVGFLYYLRGRRLADSVHVGVVAFLVTVTTWIPVGLLGLGALHWGLVRQREARFAGPAAYPDREGLQSDHRSGARCAAGRGVVVLGAGAVARRAAPVRRRLAVAGGKPATAWPGSRPACAAVGPMFALGAVVTLATFSVAVSLTLLVPLALRGAIRRDSVIPYVLGANITTYVDTLFAASALEHGSTGTVVLVTMIFATLVAGVILLFLYRPYVAAVNGAAHWISRDRRSLGLFVAVLVAVPAVLLAL